MTYGKPKPVVFFGYDLSDGGSPFSGGGRPENDIRKWKPEKPPVSGLYDLRTGFAIRERSFSGPETML